MCPEATQLARGVFKEIHTPALRSPVSRAHALQLQHAAEMFGFTTCLRVHEQPVHLTSFFGDAADNRRVEPLNTRYFGSVAIHSIISRVCEAAPYCTTTPAPWRPPQYSFVAMVRKGYRRTVGFIVRSHESLNTLYRLGIEYTNVRLR